MPTLTVSPEGDITLKKELLERMGFQPGDHVDIKLKPSRSDSVGRAKKTGTVDGFFGILAGKSKVKLTIEEINQAAADGWAGKGR